MEVELPNGQIAEFPDDMPHEQIETALRQHFAPQKASEDNKKQAFEQIKNRFPGMPEALIHAVMPAAVKMAESPEDKSKDTLKGTFARAAFRAPLEGAENLANLVGLPTVKGADWPGIIKESEYDKEHPYVQMAGGLAGSLLPGAGSVAALRSIPAWGNLVERAAPSIMRKLLAHGAEGAALGSGYSPEGERGKGALLGAGAGGLASLLPILTPYPAINKLNTVNKNVLKKGLEQLNVSPHLIEDIEQNKYLRNTKANRNLLEKAKKGSYKALFKLQSDMGGLQRRFSSDPFSAANREFGRDIGLSRQDLLNEMKEGFKQGGLPEEAERMRQGQQQYRQHMQLRPSRNIALLALLAGLGIPGYKYAKKLML